MKMKIPPTKTYRLQLKDILKKKKYYKSITSPSTLRHCKKGQTNPKARIRKDTVKIRTEMNEIENLKIQKNQ